MSTASRPHLTWARDTGFFKHLPVRDKSKAWEDVVADTKHGDAKYHSDLTLDDIRKLEMECDDKQMLCADTFYRICDSIIGAYKGKETRVVLVLNYSNTVHGYPYCEDEFRSDWKKYKGNTPCPV